MFVQVDRSRVAGTGGVRAGRSKSGCRNGSCSAGPNANASAPAPPVCEPDASRQRGRRWTAQTSAPTHCYIEPRVRSQRPCCPTPSRVERRGRRDRPTQGKAARNDERCGTSPRSDRPQRAGLGGDGPTDTGANESLGMAKRGLREPAPWLSYASPRTTRTRWSKTSDRGRPHARRTRLRRFSRNACDVSSTTSSQSSGVRCSRCRRGATRGDGPSLGRPSARRRRASCTTADHASPRAHLQRSLRR
jgi:hypothetical protein